MELEGQPMPHKNPWGEIYIQSHRESFAKIKERSVTILEEQLSADGNRIMVTHGDSITLMYYYALSRKMNPNIWLNEDYIPKGGIVKVDRKSGKLSAQVIIVENV
jgi:broad specificity phosphatase PhoE